MKVYGYVNVSKKGLMEKTLHSSLTCLRIRKIWIAVTDKSFADETKKCKNCFKEEQMRGKVAKALRKKCMETNQNEIRAQL